MKKGNIFKSIYFLMLVCLFVSTVNASDTYYREYGEVVLSSAEQSRFDGLKLSFIVGNLDSNKNVAYFSVKAKNLNELNDFLDPVLHMEGRRGINYVNIRSFDPDNPTASFIIFSSNDKSFPSSTNIEHLIEDINYKVTNINDRDALFYLKSKIEEWQEYQ